jgi:hypothetical protein
MNDFNLSSGYVGLGGNGNDWLGAYGNQSYATTGSAAGANVGSGGASGGGAGGGAGGAGGWSAASSTIGTLASALGTKGGKTKGTDGTFTMIGTSIMPGIGTAIGAVVDVLASGSMRRRQESKWHKKSRQFWADAQKELDQIKKVQAQVRSNTLAIQGAEGVRLDTGTVRRYREVEQQEQDIAYQRQYDAYAKQRRNIYKGRF